MQHERGQTTKRPYRKRKRAESEQRTRERITEAAVALHQTLGPAWTSVKAIAKRAGVDRATVYRHFPDEQALFDACTSHYYAQHPMPNPQRWRVLTDPAERLRRALTDLYDWFADTERMLYPGIRDIDSVPAGSREAFFGYFESVRAVLMRGRRERGRARARVSAAIGLAIGFRTWWALVREQRLKREEAVELMVALVEAAPRKPAARFRKASA
jgi:AcrR family transcriptional regulator